MRVGPDPRRESSGSLRAVDGVMPKWSERFEGRPVADFAHYCLRGIGQIVFMNNPVTGLLILAGMSVFSLWLGFATALGVASSTAFALLLGLDRGAVRAGLYGFNGALVGAGLATFLAASWSLQVMLYTVTVAAFSTMLVAALTLVLAGLKVPPLTLPFNLVTLAFLLAAFSLSRPELSPVEPRVPDVGADISTGLRATESGPAVGLLEGVANAVLRGISQLFLADSILVGLIILAAILVCSRLAAALALLGSGVGMLTGLALGADGYEVYHGLWGFNSFVTAVAIGDVFVALNWRSVILAAVAAAVAALLFATFTNLFSPWGLPALTLPFCLTTLAFLIPRELTRLRAVTLDEISTPEEHRRLLIQDSYDSHDGRNPEDR